MDSNLVAALIIAFERAIPRLLLRPARSGEKLLIGVAGDLTRPRSQLIILPRSIERPRLRHDEHVLLLAPARLTRRWRDALHVVSPETLLPWHRLGRGAHPR